MPCSFAGQIVREGLNRRFLSVSHGCTTKTNDLPSSSLTIGLLELWEAGIFRARIEIGPSREG